MSPITAVLIAGTFVFAAGSATDPGEAQAHPGFLGRGECQTTGSMNTGALPLSLGYRLYF